MFLVMEQRVFSFIHQVPFIYLILIKINIIYINLLALYNNYLYTFNQEIFLAL
jgi:hypothetical protein